MYLHQLSVKHKGLVVLMVKIILLVGHRAVIAHPAHAPSL